jgi:mannose-6-phosphate isomerase-like protein (cupin superfamily)
MGKIKLIKRGDTKEFLDLDELCNLYVKNATITFGTSRLEPGKEGGVDPGHKLGEEIFFIAYGTVTCTFSKETITMKEGDAVVIPLQEPHKLKNVGKVPAMVCWALAPSDP